jgi:hypothetical protein
MPLDELTQTSDATRPDLVVLAATLTESLTPLRATLPALARLALAGASATPRFAMAVGARLMAGDPVTEAEATAWPSEASSACTTDLGLAGEGRLSFRT